MANAAEVSFTFFTNCTDEQDRSFGLDLLILNRLRKRDQSDEPTTVVGDARRKQSFAGSHNREVCFGSEHGIEVRTDDEQGRLRSSLAQSETVAFFVDLDFSQTKLGKLLAQIFSALSFAKRACRNRTDPDLFIRDCVCVSLKETESSRHFT